MTAELTTAPARIASEAASAPGARRRLRLDVSGAVQGVGFRPFVYRLAREVGVDGWVANDPAGVRIEAEGPMERVQELAERLVTELPPRAAIHELRESWLEPQGGTGFAIVASSGEGARRAVVLPDIATCDDCLREILDGADRRHGYAFTNCTNCGPRYSIVRELPYDRPATTMAGFTMCPRCEAEYRDPMNRRFHAQPNACPACGPRLTLLDSLGTDLTPQDPALVLELVADALSRGLIVALEGIGGFQLLVDARDEDAVRRLRVRKRRHAKPLAVMATDLMQARELCDVSADEAALLQAPEAPIVLLHRRAEGSEIAPAVAPGTRQLGVMLPYSPLHHLLMRAYAAPLVATSGNIAEEPICTDPGAALAKLGGVADIFLVHDRPIARHVDDSVAWVVRGAPRLLRRARGHAPMPVRLPADVPPMLAVGGHQKNTVAVATGRQAFVSQHVGDLDSPESMEAFVRVVRDLTRLYHIAPAAIAHDLHPAYASTLWATCERSWDLDVPRVPVQHHHAHLASCLAENGTTDAALGIVWDGSGYGADHDAAAGTVWGGEFLAGDAATVRRVAHLASFRLPGGEAAVKEPRRVAIALLWELLGEKALSRTELAPVADFGRGELRTLASMLRHGVHSPVTTSAGRLFDGVSALLGLCQRSGFEGEAAMRLEQAADPCERGAYELPLRLPPGDGSRGAAVLDWQLMLTELLRDADRGTPVPVIAARFHNGLAAGMVAVARYVSMEHVALSGGCFQNRLLAERGADALEGAGFRVLMHRHVPPNDGGISLGQIAVAAARLHVTSQEDTCVSAYRDG